MLKKEKKKRKHLKRRRKKMDEKSWDDFISKLNEKNIKALTFGPQAIRFVTHLDFTDNHLDYFENCMNTISI